MSLLEVKGLHISFAGKPVVRGVNFAMQPGEKLALVGESGSGKTVTALSLLGLAQGAKVQGQAIFNGSDLLKLGQSDWEAVRGRDLAMVFQEPMTALNPVFTVGDQIAEVLQLKKGMDATAVQKEVVRLLSETGIDDPQRRARAYPHQLSGGQRQRAMIAMALACEPQILLADEPTTALDVTVRRQILDLLTDLQRKSGMAVLLITHDLNLVRRFADRVAVMENGVIVEHGPVADLFARPQHPYTQRLLHSKPARNVIECDSSDKNAKLALQVTGVGVSYRIPRPGLKGWFGSGAFQAVDDAHLCLNEAETLGIIGESGSGKTTLALAALGLLSYHGDVAVFGAGWGTKQTSNLALRKKIQVVFQDPFSSLSPRLTVEGIVGEGLQVHESHLSRTEICDRVLSALREVGLDEAQFPGLLQRYPHQFSGGQRQRIAVARALIVEPKILVLDEPTSALDATMAQQIIDLLQGLQREKRLSFLLITHDVAVVRAMAHRVAVMQKGKIVEQGSVDAILQHPTHDYTKTLLAATE